MKPTPARIALQIRPSFRLGCFIMATHLAAFGLVLWLAIAQPLWSLLVLPVVYSGVGSWRLHMQKRGCRLEWDGEGSWRLSNGGGKAREVQLLGNSRVWAGLMILNFRQLDGRRRSLILLSDSCDLQQQRRLRVRLLTAN